MGRVKHVSFPIKTNSLQIFICTSIFSTYPSQLVSQLPHLQGPNACTVSLGSNLGSLASPFQTISGSSRMIICKVERGKGTGMVAPIGPEIELVGAKPQVEKPEGFEFSFYF